MDDREFWRNERVAFLALTTLKGVGFWTLHKIAESKVGFKDALKEPNRAGLEKHFPKDIKDEEFQEQIWSKGLELARELASSGIQLFFNGEQGFPKKLKSISEAPHWLFVQGNSSNLNQPAIAVVGTRKPTEDGIFAARLIVAAASKYKCATVSGLALGIDQTCHNESIRYKLPTVAVLGTGILNNYPKGSEHLREQIIAQGGTVISEYLPQQSYSAENFVRRNRLQAALCEILFPAEWKIKSGTAHTVRYASRYGKTIVNTYLPLTQSERPELSFSKEEYGAISLEIPFDIPELISILTEKLTAPTQTTNCTTEQPEQPEQPEKDDGIDDDRQLPLI